MNIPFFTSRQSAQAEATEVAWDDVPALDRRAAQLTYDQVANLIDGQSGYRIAGMPVSEKTALQVSTVLSCVRVIADGCAAPELHVYREVKGDRSQLATNIPEYRLLNRRPNEFQTSFEFRRMLTAHAALTGTGLAIKSRGMNNRVRELLPVEPGQWHLERTSRYGLVYRCYDEFGVIGEFGPDDVFLLNNLQWTWWKSLDFVSLARKAVGLAMASEQSQVDMHANGLRPSGVYSVKGKLSDEQQKRLTRWLKNKAGPGNGGDPLIIDNDATWISTSQNATDAQHVETRRLQVEEVCRTFGVFPIMVGHSDKSSTFASSEAFFAAHVKHTLWPWHRAWCERIDETLLDGSGPLFARFDVRYLLSGAMKDRALYARTMVEMGLLSPNEWRDEEGLDPRPGGDEFLQPLNMTSGTKPKGNDDEDPQQDA